MSMLVIAEGLSRSYSSGATRIDALKNCSFTIATGEFVAITGASGSGKTTLMNVLGLLDRPDAGSLALGGQRTEDLSAAQKARFRNREIGFVFQSYNLLPRHSAVENIELPMIYAGVRSSERRRRALRALEEVGLENRGGHMPHQLSGGEQQRVAVARALVNEPKLVLADEPTGALDSQKGQRVLELFQQVNSAGRAIVMITHDATVARHAKRIMQMKDGKILLDRKVRDRIVGKSERSPSLAVGNGNLGSSNRTEAPSEIDDFQALR